VKRVAVIGGGVSGLCAARQLMREDKVDVQLYEASDRLGGVIRSSEQDGFLYEWAANAFLPAPDGALALAAELGVPVAEAEPAAKKRWVYVDGKCRQVPTNPVDALTTDLLSLGGKLRLLAEPFRGSAIAADETVAEFARRRLGPEASRRVIAPFVTGVFAGDAELLSLRSAFPMLAELDAGGGLVRGMIGRMRQARRERVPGEKRTRHRMAAPVGGVQALVDAVAAELAERGHVNSRVLGVERRGEQTVVDIEGVGEQSFDAVVLATPAPASAALLQPMSAELAETLRGIPYVSVAIAHLGFDRAGFAHPADGFGVIVAKGEPGVRVLGVVFESVLWSNRAPADSLLVRCIHGGHRDPSAVDDSDDELVARSGRDLRRILGIDTKPTHHHVARQRNAIAQYTVGHADRVARAERLAEPNGIVLAGAAYHGVSVNKCVADASRVSASVYRLLQLGMVCLLFVVMACGSKSSSESKDKPVSSTVIDAAAAAAVAIDASVATYSVKPATPNNSGKLTVTVDWLKAPAKVRASPGRTRCLTPFRSPVSVHTNGGVRDVVVSVLGVKGGKQVTKRGARGKGTKNSAGAVPTEMVVRNCELSPAIVKLPRLGATLAIINEDERRHDLAVEKLTGDKWADIPLAVVGRRYELVFREAGIFRVRDLADDANVAYVVVPAHAYVEITGADGTVELAGLPVGSYKVQAWRRPLAANKAPKLVVASIDVVAGSEHELRLSLDK